MLPLPGHKISKNGRQKLRLKYAGEETILERSPSGIFEICSMRRDTAAQSRTIVRCEILTYFYPLANRQLLSKCAVQRREQGGHQTKILRESGFLSHRHHYLRPNQCCVWGSISCCLHCFIPLPFTMSLNNTQWLPQEPGSACPAAIDRLKSIKK